MADELLYHPLFGLTVSVAAYAAGLLLYSRYGRMHPLFIASGSVILLLVLFDIPYAAYQVGGDMLSFVLGPATVALGVPLFKYRQRIKRQITAVFAGITLGAATGIVTAGGLIWLFGGVNELILTNMTKSVSSPMAIELARMLGGIPELSAVLTVLTGLLGSMFGEAFMRKAGIRGDLPIGIAMGTAAHGIGTAKLIQSSESQGSYGAFAMAMTGIITGILLIPVIFWLS